MQTPKEILIAFLKAKHAKSGGNCGTIIPKLISSTKIEFKVLKPLLNALFNEGLITIHKGGQSDLIKWKN